MTDRDLNAEVAEKVMGWKPYGRRGLASTWTSPDGYNASYGSWPRYSTDMAAAWLVVEKLRATGTKGWDIRLETADHDEWLCQVWSDPDDNAIGSATASTAPLAICRAALAATRRSPTHD